MKTFLYLEFNINLIHYLLFTGGYKRGNKSSPGSSSIWDCFHHPIIIHERHVSIPSSPLALNRILRKVIVLKYLVLNLIDYQSKRKKTLNSKPESGLTHAFPLNRDDFERSHVEGTTSSLPPFGGCPKSRSRSIVSRIYWISEKHSVEKCLTKSSHDFENDWKVIGSWWRTL